MSDEKRKIGECVCNRAQLQVASKKMEISVPLLVELQVWIYAVFTCKTDGAQNGFRWESAA
jgi:hypothetical protein